MQSSKGREARMNYRIRALALFVVVFFLRETVKLSLPLQANKVTIEGSILDKAKNTPIAAATVTLRPGIGPPESASQLLPPAPENMGVRLRSGRTPPSGLASVVVATTDARGRFTFPPMDPTEYRLMVTAVGYVPMTHVIADRRFSNLQLRVDPEARLRGRIVDDRGAPLARLTVYLQAPAHDGEGVSIGRSIAQVTTNDRGEYEFSAVAPGNYYILAGLSPPPISPSGGNKKAYAWTYTIPASMTSRKQSRSIRPKEDSVSA
jgi:hypothetical protein